MSAPKSKNERQTMSSLIEESAERRPGLVDRAEAEFEAGRLKSQLAAERSLLAAFQAKAAECEQAPEGVLDDETALEAFVKAKAEAVARVEIQRSKAARAQRDFDVAEKKAKDALIAYSFERAEMALTAAKARFEAYYPRLVAELSDLLEQAMEAERLVYDANKLVGFDGSKTLASVFKPGSIGNAARLEIAALDADGNEMWIGHPDSGPESRHGFRLRGR